MNKTLFALCLIIATCACTIMDVTRARLERNVGETLYTFESPYVIDGPLVDRHMVNGVQDARFVHTYIARNKYTVHQFTINDNQGIANTHAWIPSCHEYKDHYVHTALVGPLTDSRFQIPSRLFKRQNNIDWELPEGYGAVFGLHPPVERGQKRYTLNITRPLGTYPDRWYIPYNSGNQDPDCQAFQRYTNDTSTGVLGCGYPSERCPGSPYPYNYTANFCPHYKVGNFCGDKPWRWINERNLSAGKYYFVYWEEKGRAIDFSAYSGYDTTAVMGKLDTLACRHLSPQGLPDSCACGKRGAGVLPPGCIPLYPAAVQRVFLMYELLNGGSTLHTNCRWVNNNPTVPV
ncbi:Ras-related protein Rab [Acrasis kona]|uniref:Ras-related protein Rab n=1 Tax=Acrasis kona TaxID=1008807 RepID=A0AAW2Z7L6_9EUKA